MTDATPAPKFTDPFGFKDIEWRITATTAAEGDKPARGLAVAYITPRAAQDRLDAVCEANNWRWHTRFREVVAVGGTATHIECTIQIWGPGTGGDMLLYSRADVGEGHDGGGSTGDPVKTAYSDAFKRASVLYGIGRFLRDVPQVWVQIEKRGSFSQIPFEAYEVLETSFNDFMENGKRPRSRGRKASTQRQAAPAREAAPAAREPASSAPPATPSGNGTDKQMGSDEWTQFWASTRDMGYAREQVWSVATEVLGVQIGQMTFSALPKADVRKVFDKLKAQYEGKAVTA